MKVTVANMVQLSLVTFTDVGTNNIVYKSLRKECFMKKSFALNFFMPTIVHILLLCDDCETARKSLFGETKIWF